MLTRVAAVALAYAVAVEYLPAQSPEIVVPAFTAFAHPEPNGLRRDDAGGVRRWSGELRWYGRLAATGDLDVVLRLAPEAPACRLALAVGAQPDGAGTARTVDVAAGATEVAFGAFPIAVAGYHRLTLRTESDVRPALEALVLRGPVTAGAHFSTVERRNAASVHLGYDLPKDQAVEWFYVEVTPRTDPLWSYYMATGWHRGYFGIQVNSATERRVIFSVWDSGDEGVDRGKVKDEDLVQLVAKGDRVVAEGFGHEGTGGHSHLVHGWKLGDTFRFLVHAEPKGTHTVYTGWFWFAERHAWGLIASFDAPKDGGFLRGLYSFNENFAGQNGDERRLCEFGNAWVRGPDGAWRPLLRARFTHDGHGGSERLDRSAGIVGDRWYLANGGFVDDGTEGAVATYRAVIERQRGEGEPPRDEELPRR